MPDSSPPDGVRCVRVSLGHGYQLMLFAGTLVLFSAMFAMLNGPFDTVTAEASSRSSTNASAQGIVWVQQAWDWGPLWAGLLALVMLIAGAVIESGRRY